ncbi:MAG: Cna B-type domain-containing protein [Eubacteriales bacterium]|nr:Cna B-type domain-containing protein [Eubacteriales bacterium]
MRKRGFLAGLVAGLAALTAVLTMASPVMADYPTVDASQTGSLTIENYPVKGAQFRAYEVASFSGGKLVLTDGFRDAKITGLDSLDLNDMTSSDWSTLATSLANYEGLASMTPVLSSTNADGNPQFDFGTNLGLYLIEGDKAEVGEDENKVVYTPQTFLVSVPSYVNGDPTQGYTYDVIADMAGKFSTQSYKGYEVRKVWKDTPDEKRPVSVTVDIVAVKDGAETPYQTVTLSDKNNWTYKWVVDAEDAATFKIHEEITDSSFTWTLDWDTDQDNLAVATLTNTYVTPPETPTPTVKTPTPTAKTPTPTVKTPTPRTGRTPTPPVRTSTHTTTAKTGDTSHIALWIALMAAAAAAILVVVFRGRRKDE